MTDSYQNDNYNAGKEKEIQRIILLHLNKKIPLTLFCEYLEEKTGGYFSLLTFKTLLFEFYQNPKNDLNELFQKIPLTPLKLSDKNGFISLLDLYKYFANTIDYMIVSPLITLYKIAEFVFYKKSKSILDYLIDIGIKKNEELNIEELSEKMKKETELDLEKMDFITLFKCFDYQHKGKIRIEDLVLVIDTYTEYIPKEQNTVSLNQENMLAILEKYPIDFMKTIFNENKDKRIDINTFITNYVKNIQFFPDKEKISSIMKKFFDDNKKSSINYNDLMELLPKKDNTYKQTISFPFRLSSFQKKNIQTLKRILNECNISTDKLFYNSTPDAKNTKIDIFNLQKQIEIQLSEKLSTSDIKNITKSFDINKNGILSKKEYDSLLNGTDYLCNQPNSFIPMYLSEVQVPIFHILPSKGNIKVIKKIQKELNRIINLWSIQNNKGADLKVRSPSESKKKNMIINLNTDKNAIQPKNFDDYQDDYIIISSIEKIDIDFPYITCHDLISHLNRDKRETTIYNQKKSVVISQIVKIIDKDEDGFISGTDILNFLLEYLQYKSSKIAISCIKAKLSKYYQQSAKDFFNEHYEDYSDNRTIETKKIGEFLDCHFLIPPVVTKKIIKEFKSHMNPPYILGDLINEFENESEDELENNYLEEAFKNVTFDSFENDITMIVSKILGDNIKRNESYDLLIRKFNENLNTALKIKQNEDDNNYEIDVIYNATEFTNNFLKPLHINMHLGMTLFNLIKKQTKFVTATDVISLNDIRLFFIAFLPPIPPALTIDEILDQIEKKGPGLNLAIEEVPFSQNGLVAICEVMNILGRYYPLFDRGDLMKIVELIDKSKSGLVSYEQLQNFLTENSKKEKFSYLLELKLIMSKLLSQNLIKSKSEEYFYTASRTEFVRDYSNISKEEHEFLFNELIESTFALSEFYDKIQKKQGNRRGYNMKILCDELNYFSVSVESIEIDDSILLPNIYTIEEILQHIHLGMNGKIAIFELCRPLKENQRVLFSQEIDREKNGSISLKELINQLRRLYGFEINVNIKLLSENICYKHNLDGDNKKEKIYNYIIERLDIDSIRDVQIYKSEFYNIFREDFLDDEILFEQFFEYYKLKEEDNDTVDLEDFFYFLLGEEKTKAQREEDNRKEFIRNDISDENVIVNRNLLSKEFEPSKSSESEEPGQEESIVQFSENILKRYETEELTLRDIINMFTPKYIEDNITIKNSYVETLFTKTLPQKLPKDEINVIIKEFSVDESKDYFDLKRFCIYINATYPRSKFQLEKYVIEPIKDFVMNSPTTSFRDFVNTYFNKKYVLSFKQVLNSFPTMFRMTIYDCVMLFEKQKKLTIVDFFNEYKINELFTSESFDPSLNGPLKKIKDYFNSRSNVDSLFKKFDLDSNGELTYDEFIKALFQCKDLNLTENQIESIVKVADKNQDEKIEPAEFLSFLKTINDPEEIKDDNKPGYLLPIIKPKENIQPFEPKIVTNIALIKENLLRNTNATKIDKNNKFLNYIAILQEYLIKNYNNTLSMEYDFNLIDTNNDQLINKDSFKKIIEKRLTTLEDKVYYKFVSLAEQGIPSFQNLENKTNHKINYVNFLNNLMNYSA